MHDVAVIITARNAAPWIGKAVTSALQGQEAAEVWVIDDGSSDGTAAIATGADDGSGRLRVHVNPTNLGPSASRNIALQETTCAWAAILDADDFFLPGRLAAFTPAICEDCDLIADNVLFVRDPDWGHGGMPAAGPLRSWRDISAQEFILGNLPRKGKHRGELGFLKPLIKLDFLRRTGLAYRTNIRLGEDYALYTEALLQGARFRVLDQRGYVALEREQSASGQHDLKDLWSLVSFDEEILAAHTEPAVVAALQRHLEHQRHRARHREVLRDAKVQGRVAAALSLFREPRTLAYVAEETIRLKSERWFGGHFGSLRHSAQEAIRSERLLLEAEFFRPAIEAGQALR